MLNIVRLALNLKKTHILTHSTKLLKQQKKSQLEPLVGYNGRQPEQELTASNNTLYSQFTYQLHRRAMQRKRNTKQLSETNDLFICLVSLSYVFVPMEILA